MKRAPSMSRVISLSAAFGIAAAIVCQTTEAKAQMGDQPIYGIFLVEELEYGLNDGSNPVRWDAMSWVGGDWNRIWIKTEGEAPTDTLAVEVETQLLFSRLVGAFWEFQVGLRGDFVAEKSGRDGRGFLVVGFDGTAPYQLELAPALFVSHQGDVSARINVSHELFVTQRLIAESSVEINVAIQSVPEFGVGGGLVDVEMGFRLRYEMQREFAPYIGVNFEYAFADTARMRQADGSPRSNVQGVAGIRFWF